MRLFLFSLLLSVSISIQAQHQSVGIKGGVNWTNISPSNDELNDYFRSSYAFGVTFDRKVGDHIQFGAELLYLERGVVVDALALDREGEVIDSLSQGKNESNYKYIAVPIKAGYVVGEKVSGSLSIGIVPSYLLKATLFWSESLAQYMRPTVDLTERASAFDLAGLIEAGGNVQISEKLLFCTALSFQHSFIATTKSEYTNEVKRMHYGIMLTGGIKYFL